MAKKKERIIEVKNLSKRYKKAKELAVSGVSFYVERGAFFSLLGPNGAGKTTTVSILTTTLSKTSGEVVINGHDVDTEAAKVRKDIGVIFQNPSLDLNLTAEENVRFHTNLYGLYPYRVSFGMMPEEYKNKVGRLAGVLGIEEAMNKPVKALSGGMKRKLEIVRSLMHSPKILFLDEPTTGLDPISRSSLWKYLQEIRKSENTTIFLTTHYLEEAEGADYLAIVNGGKLVASGTPQEIKDTLVEKYLVVDAKEGKSLEKELVKLRIKYVGKGPYRVKLDKLEAQEVIQRIKTKLSVLKIHDPSLEEAYVKIIDQD